MLKNMIAGKGVSVYRAAKDCGLPYTTLNELVLGKKKLDTCSLKTVSLLAEYFGLSIEELSARASGDQAAPAVEINPTWAAAKKKKYRFPVKYPETGFKIERVHPLKQKAVSSVYNALRDDPRISSLILFGSAPTICCTSSSDLDFAVGLKPEFTDRESKNAVSEAIQEACGYTADIIWTDRIAEGSSLGSNISLGVKII